MSARDSPARGLLSCANNRYDKTKPGAIPTEPPIPGGCGRYGFRFCISTVTCISQLALPVAAIAPIVSIHSSITDYEPIIVGIPVTANAKAAAQEDIPYTSSARSTSVPASIPGVVAVYKLATFIVWVAENSTAAMTSSPSLAQGCGWQNDRQQYCHDDH